jgi:hypothetical protein
MLRAVRDGMAIKDGTTAGRRAGIAAGTMTATVAVGMTTHDDGRGEIASVSVISYSTRETATIEITTGDGS